MKRLLAFVLLIIFVVLPAAAQIAQYQGRLSRDDQERFDSYYQRWLDYKRTNNHDEVISMEKRMQDVMAHYNIPPTTPYDAVASTGSWGAYGQYRGRFSEDDQRRYDSYYQRWLDYKRANNREEIISMEKRMQDVMLHYQVPLTVPFAALATGTWGNYGGGYVNPWRDHLQPEAQARFDSYYRRWLEGIRRHDRDETLSMEQRMREEMRHHDIPENVPFDQIASPEVARPDSAYYTDLRVINATYGAGGHFANVTARLQDLVQNNSLNVGVNNDSMGGDPAPHERKTLNLTYSWRGQERRANIPEGGTLTIP